MSKHQAILPEGWLRAPGWSHAVAVQAGEVTLLKIAGQIGWDMQTQQLVSDDLAAQYERAILNICTLVQSAGGTPQDITELFIYTTCMDEYNERIREMGAAYRTHIGKHFPAITLLGVNKLFQDSVKIEIAASAAIVR